MDAFSYVWLNLAVLVGSMLILWLISLRLQNTAIVDSFWGIGFVFSAWLFFLLARDGYVPRKLLVLALTTIWGLRLSIHIYLRNRGKPEDPRYQAWRVANGVAWKWRSLFQVFLLQALLIWLISIPLLVAQFDPSPARLTPLDLVGILAWTIGFLFESIGDGQLSRFKSLPTNRGRVMDQGLWRLTRHPNYFGDALQWWGYYLFSLAVGGWWTFFSPVVMTYLLVRVSGVALLERTMANRPGYAAYRLRTPPFIPWFPRKISSGDHHENH